jgi:hypothetical protein
MLGLFLAVNAAYAVTHPVGVTRLAPYNTIETAIGAAADHDTLIVDPGTYTVPAAGYDVNKPLTIKGQKGADFTILQTTGTNTPVFKITADDVTISGFTMHPPYGTDLSGVRRAAVIVGGTGVTSPTLTTVTGAVITKCIIEFFPFGIAVLNADGAQITGNIIRYCPENFGVGGIGIRMVVLDLNPTDNVGDFAITNTLIKNNSIYDNGSWAVYMIGETASALVNLAGTQIKSNTFFNNGSFDGTIPPYNGNGMGIMIVKVQGPVTITSNKFLELRGGSTTNLINVDGVSAEVTHTGNKTYPKLKGTLSGGSFGVP